MAAVLAIAAHDLRRRLRDRTALMMAFVAPFALASIMGLAFGSGGGRALVRVAIVDLQQSETSAAYVDAIVRSASLGPDVGITRTGDATRAHRLYSEGRVSAAITLAPDAVQRATAGGLPFTLVESSRTRPLGKAVVDALVASARLQQVTTQVVANALSQEGLRGSRLGEALTTALRADPVLSLGDAKVRKEQSPLGYFAPSMAIVFLFLSVGAAANSVLAERATGTMVRMQAAPVGSSAVVAGKTCSIVGLMLFSVLSLWAATSLVFKAHWGSPPAVLVLSI
nr:ABC transporter permease [Actinomycetota bacterium]